MKHFQHLRSMCVACVLQKLHSVVFLIPSRVLHAFYLYLLLHDEVLPKHHPTEVQVNVKMILLFHNDCVQFVVLVHIVLLQLPQLFLHHTVNCPDYVSLHRIFVNDVLDLLL
uniref:Putative secreted protein n=1 Tax=Panstrongylus lignarius TaxID=156445 RepID=A0A224Y0T8_9HEMI